MKAAGHDEVVMDLLESTLARRQEDREAYLRATGSSPEIVAEVLDRAVWEERMAGFLETPLLLMGSSEAASSEANAGDIPHGRRIAHYVVQRELGRGGMGVVFRAVDEHLGRTVALKVLSHTAGSTLDRKRFLREAKAASALNHPNIVTIHEFDSDAGQDFIAMEYIEGKTLDKAVSPGVPLAVRLGYARQIALALARAHSAGIVHRDLKPGNIMVTTQGEVKVLDFGLAQREPEAATDAESDETKTALTMHGTVVGTPAYMSPEQVAGERVDARSDIFSFGIILYQLVCGQRPFLGGNAAALLVQISGQAYRPVREINPQAPPALAALINRCLAKKREYRLPSMDMAASALASIIAGLEGRPAARRYIPWVLAASLALAGAGGWFWQHGTLPPASRSVAPPAMVVHTLRYALLNDDGTATPSGAIYHGGTKFRFRLRPNSAGFLYLVNQGPGDAGSNRLYVLMPRPGTSAAVAASEERLTGWLVLDQNPGIERMWVIWSNDPVPALEEAANGPLRGEVRDARRAAAIQQFLAGLQSQGIISATGSGTEMQVQGGGNTLASRVELRHQ
jgi:serine/threonine protein kinase